MMTLGLVLHSAITYTQFTVYLSSLPVDDPEHFPWHFVDGQASLFIDMLFFFIHTFRMPVFFIMAGFFAALMVQKYGENGFLSNRLKRIGIPLFIAWVLLMPLERWSAFLANVIAGGRDQYIADHAWRGYANEVWNNLGAFWFLYYLLIFILIAYVAVHNLRGGKIESCWTWCLQKINENQILRLIYLTIATTVLLSYSDVPWLPDDQDFLPHPLLLAIYLCFFSLGWYWYTRRELLEQLRDKTLFHGLIGVVFLIGFFVGIGVWSNYQDNFLIFMLVNFFHSVTMWSLSFTVIGIFLKFANGGHRLWRYIADSSYFVYLIHVHVFLIIQGVISHIPAHALIKLFLCVVFSLVIATTLYHLVARHTYIGSVLNGRRYSWKTGKVVS